MKEFRSKGKGKDRKVYPVSGKKPYGTSRELAYEDVVAMRNQGKRARLIQTNKKLDLYAPYESVLPPEPVQVSEGTRTPEEPKTPEEAPTVATSENQDPKDMPVTIDQVQTMKAQLTGVMGKGWSEPTVYSKNGNTYALSIDDARVAMIYESVKGTTSIEEGPVGQKVKLPLVDFSDSESAKFLISKDSRQQILKEIRENKDVMEVVFHKPEGYKNEAYIFLMGTEDREPIILGNPLKFAMKNRNSESYTDHIPAEYFKKLLRNMGKLQKENGVSDLELKFRSDYPVELSGSNSKMEFGTFIAPRLVDRRADSIRILNERIGKGDI